MSTSSRFVTLTYSDEYIPIVNGTGEKTFDKQHLQKFFKRLRKANSQHATAKARPIRYFVSSEYGGKNGRPHYHCILFNAQKKTIAKLHGLWPLGNIKVQRVTSASIGYVCGYHINGLDDYGARAKPFALMSRKPGIGLNYLDKNLTWHRSTDHLEEPRMYVTDNGQKRRLPRYYKTKIWNREELQEVTITSAEIQKIRERKIQELSAYHVNPENYYQTTVEAMHDEIGRRWKAKKQHL